MMTERNKKLLFIGGFTFLSAAMAYGLWTFFFRPLVGPATPEEAAPGYGGVLNPAKNSTGQPTSTAGGNQNGNGLPQAGTVVTAQGEQNTTPQAAKGVTLLRDAVTQNVSMAATKTGVRFFNPEDSRFYRLNPDGSLTPLSERAFPGVQNVEWGNTTDKAVLEFPDGTNYYYDFEKQRQTKLPDHWKDFNFAPDDNEIIAKSLGLDSSNRFLVVSKPDGNEARAIQELGNNADKVIPSWSPNNEVVGFSLTGAPPGDGGQQVLLLGENHENFKSLIVPGRGFLPNWSPSGKTILYSVYHERTDLKPSLWIAGGAGDNIGEGRRSLKLNTWADKCAWKGDNDLYCAVPQSLDTGAGIARSQFTGVPDDVYHVDVQRGIATKISNSDQTHPVSHPMVSPDGKKLIFTDALSGQLYQYDL